MSARAGGPGAVRAAVASAPAAAALCGSSVEDPGPAALVADVVVHDVVRLGPSFVRVTLAGPALVDLGEDGFDTRFKLVLPGPSEVLVGDATAVPAVARILADLPPGHHGEVFLEVADDADLATLPVHPDLRVHRSITAGGQGRRLVHDVRRHLGLPETTPRPGCTSHAPAAPVDVWETPRFSAGGESLGPAADAATRVPPDVGLDLADVYAWIAGESWMVRTLRRALVGELGLDRAQVAFMGYWREGVAMR